MSAAYQQIEQQDAAFSAAREKFFALQQYMGSESSMRLTHTQLEAYVVESAQVVPLLRHLSATNRTEVAAAPPQDCSAGR